MKAWESLTLNAVTGNDQTRKKMATHQRQVSSLHAGTIIRLIKITPTSV
jgi:hypothetical protein